jgi:phage shock protein E
MDNLITVNELRDRLQAEAPPIILDVRAPEAYENGHLPGAINVPSEKVASQLMELPYNRPIIVYCNMYHPGGSSSERAAETLRDAGFHARAVQGGFPEWQESGLPIEMGNHQPGPNLP